MARAAGVPAEAVAEYMGRIQTNVEMLRRANGFTMGVTAGLAGMGPRALQYVLNGSSEPGLASLVGLARALGVEAGDLLMEPTALEAKVKERGLAPFVLRAPSSRLSSVSSTEQESATAGGRRAQKAAGESSGTPDRSHWENRPVAAKQGKKRNRGSGIAWFRNIPHDLRKRSSKAA